MESNTLNHDQTGLIILDCNVYNLGCLGALADERADDKSHDWRGKRSMTVLMRADFISVHLSHWLGAKSTRSVDLYSGQIIAKKCRISFRLFIYVI